LKKYFYVLRPILACRWILDKKSPPPMLFDELVSQELDDSLKTLVSGLVARKKTAPEKFFGPQIPSLDSYVAYNMKTIDEQIALLPREESKDWDELNNVFKNILFFSHTAQG
jgi:predicted nucleotidyltransferase